jgi:hypothetical protein
MSAACRSFHPKTCSVAPLRKATYPRKFRDVSGRTFRVTFG